MKSLVESLFGNLKGLTGDISKLYDIESILLEPLYEYFKLKPFDTYDEQGIEKYVVSKCDDDVVTGTHIINKLVEIRFCPDTKHPNKFFVLWLDIIKSSSKRIRDCYRIADIGIKDNIQVMYNRSTKQYLRRFEKDDNVNRYITYENVLEIRDILKNTIQSFFDVMNKNANTASDVLNNSQSPDCDRFLRELKNILK